MTTTVPTAFQPAGGQPPWHRPAGARPAKVAAYRRAWVQMAVAAGRVSRWTGQRVIRPSPTADSVRLGQVPAGSARGGATAGFRGPDRRVDRLEYSSGDQLTRRRALSAASCLFVLAGAGGACAISPLTVPGAGWPIAAVGALVGLATTGVLLTEWAVSRRTWPAYTALALVPAWAMAELVSMPFAGTGHQAWVSLHGLVPSAAAVLLLARGRRFPEIDTTLSPLRTLSRLVAVLTVLILVDVLVPVAVLPVWSGTAVLVAGSAAAALWCLAAVLCRGREGAGPADRYGTTVALFAFALGSIDRAVGSAGLTGDSGSWALAVGRLITLGGWVLLFGLALRSLHEALRFAARRQHTLRTGRDDLDRDFRSYEKRIDERQHDVRSLVAGIQGATSTLIRYRTHLDSSDQQVLESSLLAEVARLGRSVDPALVTSRIFTLIGVVDPVVTAERTRGTALEYDLPDVEVAADADATAMVLQNLLSNARRHAPGALVTITAEVAGEVVRVVVADDGPGLSECSRARISALFAGAPVVAAEAAAGWVTDRQHGLGLAICARLACEQGALLTLLESAVGTRIELALALAHTASGRTTASRGVR